MTRFRSAPKPAVRAIDINPHSPDKAAISGGSAREADHVRREGRQPRPLRHVPNDRGWGATTDGRGNPVADRPVASTGRASMRGARVRCDRRPSKKVCLDAVKAARSAASMPPNGWLERRRARSAGFPVVEDAQKSDSGLAITENPGNVGLNSPERCCAVLRGAGRKIPKATSLRDRLDMRGLFLRAQVSGVRRPPRTKMPSGIQGSLTTGSDAV